MFVVWTFFFFGGVAWLVAASLATPSPAALSPTGHKVYFAQTYHARFKPVRHAFKYPLFYFGIDLDADDQQSRRGWRSWLWGWGWPALFSIYAKDHLRGEPAAPGLTKSRLTELQQLKVRLLEVLSDLAVPRHEIGRVEFVSTPRVLGYCFNPLSLFYCYHPISGALRAIVLEVNNTFGERHVYVADERNRLQKKSAGYTHSHTLNRAFHVSPFNNRSGIYEAHFKDPADGSLDVLLNIKRYQQVSTTASASDPSDSKLEALWLTARVSGPSRPLTSRTCIYLALSYPLNAFLTVPRILKEAYKLAYDKRLKVYQKPGQFLQAPDGSALVRKPLQGFAEWAAVIVRAHVARQVEHSTIALTIAMPNGMQQVYEPRSAEITAAVTLRIVTANFFTELVSDSTDVSRALLRAFVRGDWTCAPQELHGILAVFSSTVSEPTGGQPLWKSANQTPGPRFAPLLIPTDWRSRFYRARSLAAIRLAQRTFSKIANFRIDPYGVERRICKYEDDCRAVAGEEQDKFSDVAAWMADDGVDPEGRERARFVVFRKELEAMTAAIST
ncbi:hypothetical protein HDU87_006341 [Geranomyces variabilis]|uniref:Uncharacterized protein n=1 Tax=Geranomyces variabilis TaxID=109894 RepID=A0AAD5TFY6_9FUNG|nr:hypothetical protein HDU87_006341 [Geranomyces variabilis]